MRLFPTSLVFAVAISLLAQMSQAADTGFGRFITRQGDKLMDGDREFRFVGVNVPGVFIPYDYTLDIPSRMVLPTVWEIEDSFKTLQQMNAGCVRWHLLPMRAPNATLPIPYEAVLAPGRFNEAAFRTIDHGLALANRYGIRVIFSLTGAGSGTAAFAGAGVYAAHRGKAEEDFYTDAQLKEDFKATIRYVLARTNSVTGVAYRDEKAILCWQLGNEMGHLCKQTPAAVVAWESEMAAFIKQCDPHHLVMNGHALKPIPGEVDANIDIYSQHYYGNPPQWASRCRSDHNQLKGKRPFIVGEFGPYIAEPGEADSVLKGFQSLLDELRTNGTTGGLLWSIYFHHQDGGFYWHQLVTMKSVWAYHWPGFDNGQPHREREILWAVRDAAFRIQGQSVLPLPVPDVPELLPVADVPLLTWRGSAGASGYDIQRAPRPEGSWKTIAENVSDAAIAYRPLYSDLTAKSGGTYYYRVLARNGSGVSQPSNVVGPVRVRAVCFVDELQDLSKTCAASSGLVLENEYNGLYAEYLYRARGDAGQEIGYQMPGEMLAIRVNAWQTNAAPGLEFQVSADGKTFATVAAEHREQRFRPVPIGPAVGRQRIQFDYTVTPVAGMRYLKLVWRGPVELDRVEILHRSAN